MIVPVSTVSNSAEVVQVECPPSNVALSNPIPIASHIRVIGFELDAFLASISTVNH